MQYLREKLSMIPCIKVPKERENSIHSYYVQPLKYKKETTCISREKYLDAVKGGVNAHYAQGRSINRMRIC